MPVRMPLQVRIAYRKLGWPDRIFFVLVLLDILLGFVAPRSEWYGLLRLLAIIFGVIVLFRLIRVGIKRAIWRLRNRLLVTYLFIAVVPVTLIAALAALGMWTLTSQFALFLVTSIPTPGFAWNSRRPGRRHGR